jgi:hypothetical protein
MSTSFEAGQTGATRVFDLSHRELIRRLNEFTLPADSINCSTHAPERDDRKLCSEVNCIMKFNQSRRIVHWPDEGLAMFCSFALDINVTRRR